MTDYYEDLALKAAIEAQYKEIKRLNEKVASLQEKCDRQSEFLRRLDPERFPDGCFIHAMMGERDQNNMPRYLWVVPAYGVDYSYVYEYTGMTAGTQW